MVKTKKHLDEFAKIIRVITIPPVMASLLFTVLYFFKDGFYSSLLEYFINIITVVIVPVLAYPAQAKLNILKGKDARENQRNLAVIFSLIGYLSGTIYALVGNVSELQLVVYLTYLFSGIMIFIGTFLIKVKFSGHMCGVSGPIVVMVYSINYYFLFLYLLLGLVFWASLYKKRHTVRELIIGTIIPIIAFIISLLIV